MRHDGMQMDKKPSQHLSRHSIRCTPEPFPVQGHRKILPQHAALCNQKKQGFSQRSVRLNGFVFMMFSDAFAMAFGCLIAAAPDTCMRPIRFSSYQFFPAMQYPSVSVQFDTPDISYGQHGKPRKRYKHLTWKRSLILTALHQKPLLISLSIMIAYIKIWTKNGFVQNYDKTRNCCFCKGSSADTMKAKEQVLFRWMMLDSSE